MERKTRETRQMISIRFSSFIAVAALAAAAFAPPAGAAMTTPTVLSDLVGTWNCTFTGANGSGKSTYTIARAGDLWVQGTGDTAASGRRPATKSLFLIGYDPKKRRFINMGATSLAGEYGISTADAGAEATTMTYANSWPADPSHERDTWHYSPARITIASTWTEKGKTSTGKASCTKR